MSLHPTSFYVWRATAGAYLYYEAIYDVDGNIVKFMQKQPPSGFGHLHMYDEPFDHSVALRRSPNRLRFHDLTEIGCVRHTTFKDVSYGGCICEIPVMQPDNYAILPREMAATPAIVLTT